ncbi:predicted protein [Histoplasma capsulatum var. duboisii H88]|uniref:Predicted protein n=1 Tax=Ajellomyces capsulatus (strain H88) TaxID=544711 RepID=F0UWC4_AJEC8|nr:predicted protein [Histoplasma capsulatum var. duboisii H88]
MRAVETAITIIIVAEDSALTTPYSIMALKLSSCLSTFHKPRFAKVLQIYLLLQDPRHRSKEEIPHVSTRIYMVSLEENEHLRGLVVEAKLKWGQLLGVMDANEKATTRLLSLLTQSANAATPARAYLLHSRGISVDHLSSYLHATERNTENAAA